MAPFEALCGKKCKSPLYWDDVSETPKLWPDKIRDMTDKVKLIQQRMKIAQHRQARYANIIRRPLCFEQGYRVFLKISSFRGTVIFGKRGNLSPRFIGPYEILEKIGELAYRLTLSPYLSEIHDVFHVSMLRKYQPDSSHILHPDEAELDETLSYFEKPIQILDLCGRDQLSLEGQRIKTSTLYRRSLIEVPVTEIEHGQSSTSVDLFGDANPMEKLLKRFQSFKPPTLQGIENSVDCENWLEDIEQLFESLNYADERRVRLVIHQLHGLAKN
ncbi:uncharacterized protein [Henckelia pumila]|uniref:uncharacterized protein n=1 Tax=Henckelia pumila TaxID=405737 RepID=UPI003C6DF9B5